MLLLLAALLQPKLKSIILSLFRRRFLLWTKKRNVKCRNMIRKSNLIHEFITYCRHSSRAFIDPFQDIISSRLSLLELLRNYIFFCSRDSIESFITFFKSSAVAIIKFHFIVVWLCQQTALPQQFNFKSKKDGEQGKRESWGRWEDLLTQLRWNIV